MSSLLGTLSIARTALEAQQASLQITTNNLANLSTPGYTRERPQLQESAPEIYNGIAFGTGVQLSGIESLRSRILDLQIGDEIQQQAKAQSMVNTTGQVQTLFPIDTSGIGQEITNFFNSLNSLSQTPADLSLRQNVLSTAAAMASGFNSVADKLVSLRRNLDINVQQDIGEVNQITSQIASLNIKLSQVDSSQAQNGSLVDQRNALIQKLSGIIDVSVLNNGSSLTLTTKRGTALVVDGENHALESSLDTVDGTQHVYSQGTDITSTISGGEIGGLLQSRDQDIPSLQNQLDSLASNLSAGLNKAHKMGVDLNGNSGTDLFSGITGPGAAASLKVAFNDPRLVAASSDGTPGSNGNLANLSAQAVQPILNGMTAAQAYGNLAFQVGTIINTGNAELDASKTILQQLQQQSSSISGVSLDEEASNLLLYQRGYEAAARAISAVDQMLQQAIHMGANG